MGLRWKIPPSRSLGQKARQRRWSELIGVGRELVGVAAELVGVGRGWSGVGRSWLVLRLLAGSLIIGGCLGRLGYIFALLWVVLTTAAAHFT